MVRCMTVTVLCDCLCSRPVLLRLSIGARVVCVGASTVASLAALFTGRTSPPQSLLDLARAAPTQSTLVDIVMTALLDVPTRPPSGPLPAISTSTSSFAPTHFGDGFLAGLLAFCRHYSDVRRFQGSRTGGGTPDTELEQLVGSAAGGEQAMLLVGTTTTANHLTAREVVYSIVCRCIRVTWEAAKRRERGQVFKLGGLKNALVLRLQSTLPMLDRAATRWRASMVRLVRCPATTAALTHLPACLVHYTATCHL